MKNKIVLILSFVLCFAIFAIFSGNEVIAENDVKMIIKGDLKENSGAFIEAGRTLLPLRLIGETLGYEVDYGDDTREVSIENKDKEILMRIGKKEYKLNNKSEAMDVAPIIKNSRTYVPVRIIAELFGEKVEWDNENRVVIVSEYGDETLKSSEIAEYEIDNLKFTLQPNEDFKKSIGVEKKGNSILFYDIYNKKESKDGSSGMLGVLNRSKYPEVITVPGIILNYDGEYYTQLLLESGVEYSSDNEEFKKRYDNSMNMLKERLKTFKVKK